MPKRIQMSRSHPWRAEHPDAVIVSRPHDWANPFLIGNDVEVRVPSIYDPTPGTQYVYVAPSDRRLAVDLFRWWVTSRPALIEQIRAELAGRDLACWCPLDQPCHADVLLALANPTPAPAGVSAAPASRDRPIGPAGAPIPTTSEEQPC